MSKQVKIKWIPTVDLSTIDMQFLMDLLYDSRISKEAYEAYYEEFHYRTSYGCYKPNSQGYYREEPVSV